MTHKSDATVVAGRGFILITMAKLYFMVTGAVLMLALPRLFGSTALFGDFATVNSLIRILNMVMITGTLQAVSKLVSEVEHQAGAVKRVAMRTHVVFAGALFAIVFFGADLIAAYLLHDRALAQYIRIAAFIPLLYAFYAVMVGLLNGLRLFSRQALLDMAFSTLKTGLIIALVISGYAVSGAFLGFVLASAVVLVLSLWTTRRIQSVADPNLTYRRLLTFMIPISIYTLCYNLLLNQDLLMIKSLQFGALQTHFESPLGQLMLSLHYGALGLEPGWVVQIGAGVPLSHDAATLGTSMLSGYFGAMKTISNLPYQAVIAVTFVIFPLISQSTFRNDTAQTRTYVRNTFRFSYLVIMLLLATLLPTGEDLMALVYGSDYRVGADALQILLLSTVLFSLFVICTTVITSAGFPKTTLGLGAATAMINAALCYWLISRGQPGVTALTRAAWADLIAIGCGALLGFVIIHRALQATPPFWSFLRISLAGAATCFLGDLFHVGAGVMVLVKCTALAVIFLAILASLGEFSKADLMTARRIIRKK